MVLSRLRATGPALDDGSLDVRGQAAETPDPSLRSPMRTPSPTPSSMLVRPLAERFALSAFSEAILGVLMDRSIPFLVSMLGAWKAAAAYVPLNPRHPGSQLEHIVEQTHPPRPAHR